MYRRPAISHESTVPSSSLAKGVLAPNSTAGGKQDTGLHGQQLTSAPRASHGQVDGANRNTHCPGDDRGAAGRQSDCVQPDRRHHILGDFNSVNVAPVAKNGS
jgi:hypothetical protein